MQRDLLDIYTDYLISQNQYATATGLAKLLDDELSHDQVTRFLNQNEFTSKDLWNYVKPQVRKHEEERNGEMVAPIAPSFADTGINAPGPIRILLMLITPMTYLTQING